MGHGQQRRQHDLAALLTSGDLIGLEVVFASGLRYVVGIGFADPDGARVRRAEAYPALRDAWHAAPGRVYPAPEGDTSQRPTPRIT